MIAPPDRAGVVFSEAVDGDLHSDLVARDSFSRRLGIQSEWAKVRQVHGERVVEATHPGDLGEADAVWSSVPGLPVGVFTADCLGVVLVAPHAVGVAHAGWRGLVGGVVNRLLDALMAAGHRPEYAAVGPGIGACCFEVGEDVGRRFERHGTTTTWGTGSVDLAGFVKEQLRTVDDVWVSGRCTMHEDNLFSHRANATSERMVALAWI